MKGISVHNIGQAMGSYVAKKTSQLERTQYLSYGAEILVGSIIKLITLFIVAMIIGIVFEVTILLLVTGLIRTFSGGAHCTAYYRCLITSILTLTILGYLVRVFYPFIMLLPVSVLGAITILSAFLYRLYAPQAPPNKPFSNRKQEHVSKWTTLFIVTICSSITIILGSKSLVAWIIAFGLLWQAFTLTPGGHGFINLADTLLSPEKKGGEIKC